MSASDSISFLSLSVNLRILIYTFHYKNTTLWVKLADRRGISKGAPSKAVSLIQTCRQIQKEATPLFYDWAEFHVENQLQSRGYTPSHSPTSDKRFDFTLPRGLRVLEIDFKHTKQLGHDVQNSGRWNIIKPFDQLRHLKIESEIILDTWEGFEPSKALRKKQKRRLPPTGAAKLKAMAEAWQGPTKLSIRVVYSHGQVWGKVYVLYMEDPKQISTWTCGGRNPETHFQHVCRFLQEWGLTRDQIKSVFMTCNRMGCELTDEQYEKIRAHHRE